MSRQRWKRAILVVVAIMASPNLLRADCETKVVVLFDVSGSTESRAPVMQFLGMLREDKGPVKLEFIPFGVDVGKSCREVALSDAAANFDACLASSLGDRNLNFRTTDLTKPFKEITKRALEVIPPGKRRVFVVFSDLRHESGNTLGESTADWLSRHRVPVASASFELDRVKGQKLILFLQEFKGSGRKASRELADIASALGQKNLLRVAIVSETGLFEQMVLDELGSDPTRLEVALKRVYPVGAYKDRKDQAVLEVDVDNPGCFKRGRYAYELRSSKGAPIPLTPLTPNKCKPDAALEDTCILTLDASKLHAENCREEYSLRVEPDEEDLSAGETKPFTIDNCLEIKSIELDVAVRLNGAPHFQGCYDRRTKLKEEDLQERVWRGWSAHDLSQQKGEVEFIACIEAKGSLSRHTGSFTLEEKEKDPPEELSKVTGVPMLRFMDGSPPDAVRFFPVFFKLSKEKAREICAGAHEEAPGNLHFQYEVTPGQGIEADRLLARSRNRDAEENLHDLWESILVPVVALLIVVYFALRNHRHGSPGVIEELLAILGFGIAALAAALHDATMRGDEVEKKFAKSPELLSFVGIGILVVFFIYLLWAGFFESHVNPEVGVRIVRNSSLTKRMVRFGIRSAVWFILISLVPGWVMQQIVEKPKVIESCHYTGFPNHRAAP